MQFCLMKQQLFLKIQHRTLSNRERTEDGSLRTRHEGDSETQAVSETFSFILNGNLMMSVWWVWSSLNSFNKMRSLYQREVLLPPCRATTACDL